MSTAIDRALAELRAIPTRQTPPKTPDVGSPEGCCTGDRPGYQWHQRTGTLPACAASLEANRAYMNTYQRGTGRTTRAGRRKRVAA
jgi:hypothetical protein